jgi:formate hydrogenlyase subunit 4
VSAPVWLTLAHIGLVLGMPFLLIGVINRTKSWWAARKGPGCCNRFTTCAACCQTPGGQPHRHPAVSRQCLGGAGLQSAGDGLCALLGQFAPLSFAHDFVAMAYTLGLARLVLMLAAMDVGSPFEGMGASREAMFGAFAEPALFLLLGTLSAATGLSSFADLLGQLHHTPYYALIVLPLALALLMLLQTEAARVPVDDPQTHLELTMIHEVMILDHSGPDLAAMQYAAGSSSRCMPG